MKNIFKISILALGLLFTSSCNEDLLDTYAPGQILEENALKTSKDLDLLMNSAISIMGSRSESEYVSIFTDEVGIGVENGGQGINDDYVYFINPGSDFANSIWIETYAGIARLNRILEAAKTIVPLNVADANKINNIKAQALTLRAYGHLRILSYYSPNMTDDNALAGIIADKVYVFDVNDFPRSTNGAFYTFIHKDLDDAIALFTSTALAANPNYGNINFAKGLKARAYSYKGDYINAELWANNTIASGLPLANKPQYQQMFWTDTVVPEILFRVQRNVQQNSQGTNLHNAWYSGRPDRANGAPFYEVGRALANKLNPTNIPAANLIPSVADVRAGVIIGPDSVIDPNYAFSTDYLNSDILIINKHGGRASGATWALTSPNRNNNSFKIMRMSEMYTIKAEARAKVNDYPGIRAALNTIRTARGAVAITDPTTPAGGWKAILDEKRLEFAFEGYRYLDLKRLGTKASSGIDRDPADYSSTTNNYPGANPINLPLSSFKFTLPIPTAETTVNTAIVQNPGY